MENLQTEHEYETVTAHEESKICMIASCQLTTLLSEVPIVVLKMHHWMSFGAEISLSLGVEYMCYTLLGENFKLDS